MDPVVVLLRYMRILSPGCAITLPSAQSASPLLPARFPGPILPAGPSTKLRNDRRHGHFVTSDLDGPIIEQNVVGVDRAARGVTNWSARGGRAQEPWRRVRLFAEAPGADGRARR